MFDSLPDLYSGDLLQTGAIIAAMGLGFFALEFVLMITLKPLLLKLLNADGTDKKASGVATQAVARIVGGMHNFVQVPIALMILLNPAINSNRIQGRNALSELMCFISAGYFLHDLFTCIARFSLEGPAYTMHALCCFLAYFYGAYSGLIHFHGAAFLMWELSTPFVHLRWFLYKMKKDHTKLYLINGLMMVLAFFLARIAWGYYAGYVLVDDMSREHASRPGVMSKGACLCYIASAFIMNGLNSYWFYKMAERAGQVVFGGKKTHEVGREKDD